MKNDYIELFVKKRIRMRIILATSNKGKIREIAEFLKGCEVLPYTDVMEPFEIKEDADTFKENALLKAKAVYARVKDKNDIVLADDSGISVPILGNIPGIYSARFAGAGAGDKDNLYKLIDELKKNGLKTTPAFYTAAIAIVTKEGAFTVHGWMHGNVINEARGDKGFGYDPMFIPKGYKNTLGELDMDVKKSISHRSKALNRAKILISSFAGDTDAFLYEKDQ